MSSVLFSFRLLLIFLLMTVTISYSINPDCNNLPAEPDINSWVIESRSFFRRASNVLATGRTNEDTLLPCVKEIVDACLGTRYTIQDINYIQTVFNNIANNLNPNQMDINIRCSDPQVMYEGKRSYPVSIDRLGGQGAPGQAFWYLPVEPNQLVSLAETFNVMTTEHLNYQRQVIGTRAVWCDIILFSVLEGRYTSVRRSRITGDWSFNKLLNPIDQPGRPPFQFSLLNFDTATLAMMHEFLHSCAAGIDQAYTTHSTVGTEMGRRAINSLGDVLKYARRGGYYGRLTANPGSLSHLAFMLNMPWYKWWDRTPGHSLFDGIVRWNNDPGSNGFILPPFMTGQGNQVLIAQMARGPFAFT